MHWAVGRLIKIYCPKCFFDDDLAVFCQFIEGAVNRSPHDGCVAGFVQHQVDTQKPVADDLIFAL